MQSFGLYPSACTVYVCRVCILPPSLHSTPCVRFTFTSVCSLYFSQNPTGPGTPCFPQTSRLRLFHKPRDPVFSIDPRDPGTPVPHYPLNLTNDRDGYSHRRSIFWKTLLFSLQSLLDFLTFVVLILHE